VSIFDALWFLALWFWLAWGIGIGFGEFARKGRGDEN